MKKKIKNKKRKRNKNYRTEINLHPTFNSVKYCCGGILRIAPKTAFHTIKR